MRLFSRRKEFQLDDPRLVGIGPLKAIGDGENEESGSGECTTSAAVQTTEQESKLPVASSSLSSTSPKKSTVLMYLPTQLSSSSPSSSQIQQEEKCTGAQSFVRQRGGGGGGAMSNEKQGDDEKNSSSCNNKTTSSSTCTSSTLLRDRNGNKNRKEQQHHQQQGSSSSKNDAATISGGGGLSTWGKRVSLTWDTIRRAESTEALHHRSSNQSSGTIKSNNVLTSSTLNRRKTLYLLPDDCQTPSQKLSDKLKDKLTPLRHAHSTSKLNMSNKKPVTTITPNPVSQNVRKIGRVESLRMLLSKSQSRLVGNSNNNKSSVKCDKGTDTGDLPNLSKQSSTEDPLEGDDDLLFTSLSPRRSFLHSAVSSSSTSHLPTSPYDFDDDEEDLILGGHPLPYMLSATGSSTSTSRRCSLPSAAGVTSSSSYGSVDQFMMKTTSCENLSSIMNSTLSRAPPHLNARYLANNLDAGGTLQKATSMATMTTNAPSSSNAGKRSSFPYAYIRSKLTALPEEPQPSSNGGATSPSPTPTGGNASKPGRPSDKPMSQTVRQPQKPPRRSLSQRNFFHSMGDLLHSRSSSVVSTTATEATEDDDADEDDEEESRTSLITRRNSRRAFDPLTQVRLDLLHKNPPEDADIDFECAGGSQSSPLGWGKRSHSIGDILTESTRKGQEEMSSGYDSDSTRNGHESPKMGGKSKTEADTASSSSSDGAASPTCSQEDVEVKRESWNSGPMAYVTLSRERSNGNGASKSSLPKPVRTLPRSQSISCININTMTTKSSTLGPRKRRRGSVDVTPTSMASTSDEEDEDKRKGITTAFGSKTCVLLTHGGSGDSHGNPVGGKMAAGNSSTSKAAPSLRLRNKVRERERPRSQSLCLSIFSVQFEKGPTKKSLGFSVVGGKDSPRGSMGIFIKRIFPYGQASEEGSLTEGDEILSVNGQPLSNVTHKEALNIFKDIKGGEVVLQVARREKVTTGGML